MESKVTASEMVVQTSVSETWKLRNWKKYHKLLASEAKCMVEIGADVTLRFFLKPCEKVVVVEDGKTIIHEWYSLWVECIKGSQQLVLVINAKDLYYKFNAESQMTLNKNPLDGSKRDSQVAIEEFIYLRSWTIDSQDGLKKAEVFAAAPSSTETYDELNLQFRVTVLELNEEEVI